MSCTNRPLHNEHENVICAKKSFVGKKNISNFWAKNKTMAARIFLILTFFKFLIFHVFFIKVVNITLADQDRNMCIFYQNVPNCCAMESMPFVSKQEKQNVPNYLRWPPTPFNSHTKQIC